MSAGQTAVETRRLVDKLWNYCNLLRDEGVSTIDYVEQLTFLLFLKIAHEKENSPFAPERILPDGPGWKNRGWQELVGKSGEDLKHRYQDLLEDLGNQPEGSPLHLIFNKATNKIQNAANLAKLINDLIGKENWSIQGTDVKGDAYEQLLARGAEDIKSGAGQYFTPRPLIDAMVRCVRPTAKDTITDPACGTGGFLLAAHAYIVAEAEQRGGLDPDERRHISEGGIWGTELVQGTARLAAMNLLLHGIGSWNGKQLIRVEDALAKPGRPASVVLANPPFGRKSSITIIGEDGRATREDISYSRTDFWVTTTNKQLNFVQHIAKALDIPGRAAVVVPDNVLFEGGAGETIRRKLLTEYDVHTLLRLPTGIFYAGGVKANVLFFDAKPGRPGKAWTDKLAVYDFRTNQHFTLKQNALRKDHLDDFVEWYLSGERPEDRKPNDRVKVFDYEELIARDKVNLDLIGWVKDESQDDADSLLPPEMIAAEIVEDLQAALAEFAAVAEALANRPGKSPDTN
ncbi:class I SAM-dependent DNA methyltransferase [Gandjariella thermophila]|uniref:site-specific DNA-methyltransferase (adenine-specific) n=1 Tax=Gandjariella thermophila TaxID=1931992 RepID=A0A4D4JFD8_9PSEU|nr:class I SAM-dependent DNA methyltransferase [Gandjariella thermophila]GDY33039.1 DNA methyltransferase [Gandjariella thermophila]